jgi:hypothetical protein
VDRDPDGMAMLAARAIIKRTLITLIKQLFSDGAQYSDVARILDECLREATANELRNLVSR